MYKNALKAIPALVAALVLSACGGGGGGSDSSASNPTQPANPAGALPYQVQGTAPVVTGVAGKLAVLFAPATLGANGLSQGGTLYNTADAPLASFATYAQTGGYTTIAGSDTASVTLNQPGVIADVNGYGGFISVGRWSKSSDSSGGTYNVNQGAPYAIGNPLTLTAGTGTLNCTRYFNTAPTAVNGNVGQGTLNAATATLDLSTLTLTNLAFNVSIGSDQSYAFTSASASLNGMSSGNGATFITRVMGSDVNAPLVAVAYGTSAPTSGDINGLVVLSCTKPV
ncbi:hypothetical protein B0G84_8828 [Paraburkholderia sp. BL8N3]|nr:hypothetical protein [Paraburkholderia sp. BL8N3]TCK31774.1 hypothetical protein B0G84_8828 [Paraburkholderia sp. BL8N3]